MAFKDFTLDFWVEKLGELYEPHDSRREIGEIWLPVMEYGSKIAEAIRKPEYIEADEPIAHTFAWLCSYVARCRNKKITHPIYRIRESLSEIIAKKYPGVCGHCVSVPCDCGRRRISLEKSTHKIVDQSSLRTHYQGFHYQGYKITDWVNMFGRIYANSIYATPVEVICFHFLEEIGEVSRAIRKLVEWEGIDTKISKNKREIEKRKKEVKYELADVFSWLSSIYIKIHFIRLGFQRQRKRGKGISFPGFAENLWKIYGHRDDLIKCPSCNKNPCSCTFYFRQRRLYP